jgi:hypothetical protein
LGDLPETSKNQPLAASILEKNIAHFAPSVENMSFQSGQVSSNFLISLCSLQTTGAPWNMLIDPPWSHA